MFTTTKSNDGTNKPKRPSAGRDNGVTILTSGCQFTGKMFCRGSSRIAGRIEGQIVSEGVLIIEEDAVITADIKAEEVVIQGRVTGRLEASGRVELCRTSRFQGDIITGSLIINEGALFNGQATMHLPEASDKKPHLVEADGHHDKKHLPEISVNS